MPDRHESTFGARLRSAREAREISLRRIAGVTRISLPALEALERNDISRLPGGIFSRAFVRAYATEVGLDPEQTVRDFIASFPQESVLAGHPVKHEQEERQVREKQKRRFGRLARLAGLGLPALLLAGYLAVSGFRASTGVDASVVADAGGGVRSAVGTSAVVDHPATASARSDLLQVAIAARSACWVSATVDGHRSIQRLLEPGEHAVLQVRDQVVLTAGDAAALELTINGEAARALGGRGQVVTVRIDPGNYRTFLAAGR
ncbi:MAG TPA: helix-turn-helix domain-containing protein [Vicinamibacterales bacterium]|nr:helix-turn-helix domain-containing protein [Vicinamibacterales bacterium]